jgi:hypothetical protein
MTSETPLRDAMRRVDAHELSDAQRQHFIADRNARRAMCMGQTLHIMSQQGRSVPTADDAAHLWAIVAMGERLAESPPTLDKSPAGSDFTDDRLPVKVDLGRMAQAVESIASDGISPSLPSTSVTTDDPQF